MARSLGASAIDIDGGSLPNALVVVLDGGPGMAGGVAMSVVSGLAVAIGDFTLGS